MTGSTVLFQSQQLLCPELLVMNLACRFNEILQMGPRQEVSQRYEFAMVLILHIDHTPSVLSTAHRTTVDNDRVLGSNNCKGDQIFDVGIHGTFFFILLIIVVRVHPQIMEGKFLPDALLEGLALFHRERVGLSDHRNDIDNVCELFEHDNVNRFEAVSR